jgi:photosystem II stability/assembly factor-like uncharacterized protein
MKMKRKSLILVFQAILMVMALEVFASWESNGPYGGRMMSAVRIGNDLFAGTFGGGTGIHKSTDNGANWTLIAENMQSTQLFTDGTSLYAVSWYIMYRSDDAGATWIQISPDFGPAWQSHSIDFVGDYLIYFNKNKVYRTATQNPSWADWEDVSGIFTTQNLIVSSVVVNNNTIIAGVDYPNTTDKGGFYRSTDFGSTWTQINNGYGLWSQGSLLTNRFPSIWALEYHEGTLFAGSRNFNAAPQGLWKSIDNGDSWTHIGFLNNAEPRTILSFNGSLFVGTSASGFYKSSDGGNTWSSKNGGLNIHQYYIVRSLFKGINNSLIAVTDISILKSDDVGETWTVSVNGINEMGTDDLGAIDETVFMSSFQGGIFKSTDNGQSWTDINPAGITALRYVKVMESILWLTNSSSEGINLTSGDNGDTWHFINPPSGNSFQSYIEHNQYLFVTTNAEDGGIARSANLGQTWETLSVNNGAAAPKRLARFGNAVYVGDHNTGHIWRSTDNGQTWATTGATGFPWGAAVTGKDNYVYLSGDAAYPGIFRSNDNGLTFTLLDNKGFIEVYSSYIHQKWFDNITNKWITRRSYNYGDTWEIVSGKFFAGNQYYLKQANGLLYASSNSQLFQSVDEGNTWVTLPSPPVNDISSWMMHVVGSTIYLGTQNSGLWHRNEPEAIVNTLSAEDLTANSANLTGIVNPNQSICSITFEYGLSTNYGSVVQAIPEIVTGSNPVYITAFIDGLEMNTTYNFRTVAVNSGGVFYGPNRTFSTLSVGIDDIENYEKSTIYPNPFINSIQITNQDDIDRLIIINALGQIVADKKLNGDESINISGLPKGVYQVILYKRDNSSELKRIIKN